MIYTDCKRHILPNIGVLIILICGIIYHICGAFFLITPPWWNLLLGALIGGLFLGIIRFFANKRYKTETLGMGDIKLILAAGVWVGFPAILHVICFGAFLGALLGVITQCYKKYIRKQKMSLLSTRLPAGPGFILAMIGVIFYLNYEILFLLTRLVSETMQNHLF